MRRTTLLLIWLAILTVAVPGNAAVRQPLGGGLATVGKWICRDGGIAFCGPDGTVDYEAIRLTGALRLGSRTYVGGVRAFPGGYYTEVGTEPLQVWFAGTNAKGDHFQSSCTLRPNAPHGSARTFRGPCSGSINGGGPVGFRLWIETTVTPTNLVISRGMDQYFLYAGTFIALQS